MSVLVSTEADFCNCYSAVKMILHNFFEMNTIDAFLHQSRFKFCSSSHHFVNFLWVTVFRILQISLNIHQHFFTEFAEIAWHHRYLSGVIVFLKIWTNFQDFREIPHEFDGKWVGHRERKLALGCELVSVDELYLELIGLETPPPSPLDLPHRPFKIYPTVCSGFTLPCRLNTRPSLLNLPHRPLEIYPTVP